MTKSRSLCILLVEDDADSRSALARLLKMSGHRAVPAGSVAEALRVAKSHRCDIVVSDVGLPDRSGPELMRELAALYSIPGIAVSGYTDSADVKECERAGFARHIKKPVDFQLLLQALEELTRGHDGDGPSAEHANAPGGA
jgi:CheY-like chemotaxis protein